MDLFESPHFISHTNMLYMLSYILCSLVLRKNKIYGRLKGEMHVNYPLAKISSACNLNLECQTI